MRPDTAGIGGAFFVGGGEMGARMRAMDWSQTPLGPVDQWPTSLRSTVGMLLPSKTQIILFWGPEFAVLYNDAYRPVFGAKHPGALGLPGREAWSEIWHTQLHDLLAGVVRTGDAFSARDLLFVIERNGFEEETYFDVSYDPVRIDTGDIGGVYCIVTETTERVVGERRLALLRDLAAWHTTATTMHDACALAMSTLESHSADIVFALAYLGDVLQSSTPDARELRARAHDEHVHTLPISLPGFDGEAGTLVVGLNPRRPFDSGYRAFLQLVAGQLGTALANAHSHQLRRQALEAQRESEANFWRLFDAMEEGYCVIELMFDTHDQPTDCRFLETNPAFEKQTGLVDARGRRIRELVGAHDQDWLDTFGTVARTGQTVRFERWAPSLGRWYDVCAFRVGAPRLWRVGIVFNDITQRKAAEEALERRSAQLSRLASDLTLAEQHAREQLAKTLHDGLQQTLLVAAISLDQHRKLETQRGVASLPLLDEARRQIDEAVAAARSLSVELYPPVLQSARLADALAWLADWTGTKYGLTVNVSCDPLADSVRRDVRTLLFESVRELLLNAVKHARVDHVTVELMRQDDMLCVSVSDGGVGFDAATIERRINAGQTGWGLFSIRERLTLLGGRFEMESTPDHGTRFRLIAPRSDTMTARDTMSQANRVTATPAVTPPDAGLSSDQALRILLVDDHAVVRQVFRELLEERSELRVVGEAADGVEAIAQAHALHPDVILMDVSMPRMDGVEATRRIHEELPSIQILGLSVHLRTEDRPAIERAGAVGFFTKNTDTQQLIDHLLVIRGAISRVGA